MINDVLYWETVGYVKGLHISLYVKEKYIPKISMVMYLVQVQEEKEESSTM